MTTWCTSGAETCRVMRWSSQDDLDAPRPSGRVAVLPISSVGSTRVLSGWDRQGLLGVRHFREGARTNQVLANRDTNLGARQPRR